MTKAALLARIRENIRVIMAIRRWSQTDLANEIGCSQSYIARILTDKKSVPPSEDFITKLSEVTEVSVESLLHADLAKKAQRFLARESLPDNGLTLSPIVGTSDELIPQVLHLQLPQGSKICDPWYGNGTFWKQVDRDLYDLWLSDLEGDGIDARRLPFRKSTFDAVVLDPPWMHTSKTTHSNHTDQYNNRSRSNQNGDDKYMAEILRLYSDSAKEAHRVLRSGGLLFCKCRDQVCSSRFHSHLEIVERILKVGFTVNDCFVLTQYSTPGISRGRQIHSRRNHSFLLVFIKRSRLGDPHRRD